MLLKFFHIREIVYLYEIYPIILIFKPLQVIISPKICLVEIGLHPMLCCQSNRLDASIIELIWKLPAWHTLITKKHLIDDSPLRLFIQVEIVDVIFIQAINVTNLVPQLINFEQSICT